MLTPKNINSGLLASSRLLYLRLRLNLQHNDPNELFYFRISCKLVDNSEHRLVETMH